MKRFLLWLLVPLLPVIGLTSGLMLTPENKPSWRHIPSDDQFKVDDAIKVLGHVNHGATLLVAELTLQETQPSLIGIDVSTGLEQFRYVLTNDLLPARDPHILDALLSEDGQHVFLIVKPDLYNAHRQIIMFDWNSRQVSRRFSLNTNEYITFVRQCKDHLVAKTSQGITLWKMEQPDEPLNIPFDCSGQEFGVTTDGSIVYGHRIEVPRASGGTAGFWFVMSLYDVKKQLSLPFVVAEMNCVNWAPDSQSFTSIIDDSDRQSLVRRQFIRENDMFNAELEKDHVLHMQGTAVMDQRFLVIASSVKKESLRRKIDLFLGSTVSSWLDRIWPDAQTFSLFDRSTTRLLHKLTLPVDHKALANPNINCHPQGHGVALWNSKGITYWDLYPTSRWYPRLGLLLGVLLATLLAWKLVRRQPTQAIANETV